MTATIPMQASPQADEIRAFSARWLAAVDSRDVERIVSFYADDGAFLVPNVPLATERDAVRVVWTRLLAAPGLSLIWTPISVDVARGGDMAFEIGSYHLEMDAPTGRTTDDGKYLVVWRRSADVWQVAADMFNSSRPSNI
jgi:ketosteroid isomerase-like protein